MGLHVVVFFHVSFIFLGGESYETFVEEVNAHWVSSYDQNIKPNIKLETINQIGVPDVFLHHKLFDFIILICLSFIVCIGPTLKYFIL